MRVHSLPITSSKTVVSRDYVAIGGFGRSGSNFILKMFDAHEMTHCRNEPNDLEQGALSDLWAFFPEDLIREFADLWPIALDRVATTVSARDDLPAQNKLFLKKGIVSRLASWLQSKRRGRKLLGLEEEWPCPAAIYDTDLQAKALPVLKIMLDSGGLRKAHDIMPGQHVVHLIRRPDGFLNSWLNRYVLDAGEGHHKVWSENQASLTRILAYFDEDPTRCSQYSSAALIESELWRWRYLNESLLKLSPSSRYKLVTYEAAKAAPLKIAQDLYDFAGLDFGSQHQQRIAAIKNRRFAAPHTEAFATKDIDTVMENVLKGSPLASLI